MIYSNMHGSVKMVKIVAGEYYVSTSENEVLTTILGSCVSACIRDPYARVGGMNHFLLPGEDYLLNNHMDKGTRYGAFAMETLINAILAEGGRKERFEVKVFGGSNITNNSNKIGSKNTNFIRNFLHQEGLQIVSENLEGDQARCIHYYPVSGEVMMRKTKNDEEVVLIMEEKSYKNKINNQDIEGEVNLF